MVRKVTLRGHLEVVEPQVSPLLPPFFFLGSCFVRQAHAESASQTAFAILFGDDRFAKRFHQEINDDSDAEVSAWSADGQRLVKFSTPLDAPSVIRKLVGVETLRITDTQRYTRVGSRFEIQCDPVIQIPGGDRFCTSGEIILEPEYGRKGTVVTINLVFEFKARGVWGVQGTMESFMEDQAKRSFKSWMRMGKAFCREEVEKLSKVVHSPSGSDQSEYHDVERLDSASPEHVVDVPAALPFITTSVSGCGGEKHLEVWFVNSVMRELNGIQMSTTVSKAHLEMLVRKMQKLEDDLRLLRGLLQHRHSTTFALTPTAWKLLGFTVAAAVVYVGITHAYPRTR